MICAPCQKKISFNADVCPYCHSDTAGSKVADQVLQKFVLSGALLGLVLALTMFWDKRGYFVPFIFSLGFYWSLLRETREKLD